MADGQTLLRKAVAKVTEDWAAIYVQRENGAVLIKSLLAGAERRIRERVGQISDAERMTLPKGADPQAFFEGKCAADEIPNAILRRAYKS
jgi:hypothetical protein